VNKEFNMSDYEKNSLVMVKYRMIRLILRGAFHKNKSYTNEGML